jgi:starch-binding outer membrane protein, SusD/RagB family
MKNLYFRTRWLNTRSCVLIFPIIILLLLQTSCKKILDVQPELIKTSAQAFANDASADSVVVGMYFKLSEGTYSHDMPLSTGLSSDELLPGENAFDENYIYMYRNALDPVNAVTNNFWSDSYNVIYIANSIIDGVSASKGMSAAGKKRCTGEAQFIRAFAYFYLVNFFGQVPLVTTTDYKVSSVLPRSATTAVYQQIVNDLLSAESNLTDDYPTAGRVRANKWAAKALLARVYLYLGDWANANKLSSEVITNSASYSLEKMSGTTADDATTNIFHSDSKEIIFQFWNSYGDAFGVYTLGDFAQYMVNSTGTDNLLDAFEADDLRKINYISYSSTLPGYFVYKYRLDGSTPADYQEYVVVLRLAEQYLIRAEALARLGDGNNAAAVADINVIRKRAGLGSLQPNLSQQQILNAVEQERRVELCFEWADRWLNLKRLGKIDAVMHVAKPQFWKPTASLYPVPQLEIQNNVKLTQNPGY